jgi:hypothetical protein
MMSYVLSKDKEIAEWVADEDHYKCQSQIYDQLQKDVCNCHSASFCAMMCSYAHTHMNRYMHIYTHEHIHMHTSMMENLKILSNVVIN